MQIKHAPNRLEITAQLTDNSILSWLASLWYLIVKDPTRVQYHGSSSLYPEPSAPALYTLKLIFDGQSKIFSCLDRGAVIECPFDLIKGIDVTEKSGKVSLQIQVSSGTRSFDLGRCQEPAQIRKIEKLARSVVGISSSDS